LPRDIARLAKFSHILLALKVSYYSNDPVDANAVTAPESGMSFNSGNQKEP
jgi:hypothetical protein